METFSPLLALCAGNTPVNSPSQRPVMRSFDIFFDLRMNKRLSKQSWGWWFDMPSCSLWRHCNEKYNFSALAIWFRLFCIKPSRVLWMLRRLKPPTTHKFFQQLVQISFSIWYMHLEPQVTWNFSFKSLGRFLCIFQMTCKPSHLPKSQVTSIADLIYILMLIFKYT